jgi:integrase
MPRIVGKLSTRRVATARPKRGRKALVLADGGNLYLQCTLGDDGTTVRRSWVFRYEIDGKRREAGLGPLHTRSLAEARDKAREMRLQLLEGVDPLEAREADRRAKLAEQARTVTFERCAQMYLDLHADGWSVLHRHQWNATLRTYILPTLGKLAVSDIDQAAVSKVVQPIWKSKTTTASRVRSRIEAILDYAAASGFRSGDNPARHIAVALPKKARVAPVQHFRALPWQDIPAFVTELRRWQSVPARCLEFLILTGVRTGEALRATWDEIDDKTKTWTIPASRMKARTPHRVPLSARVLELLRSLPQDGRYLFGGSKPLPETALRKQVLRRLRPGMTVHGFRASFKTWAGERTNFARETVEIALAHKIGDQTEQAYERGDKFEKRRRLMQAWADYLAKPAAAGGVVTPMRRRAG